MTSFLLVFFVVITPLAFSNLFYQSFELPKILLFLAGVELLTIYFVFWKRKLLQAFDIWDELVILWLVILTISSWKAGNFNQSFWGSNSWHQGIFLQIHLSLLFIFMRRLFVTELRIKDLFMKLVLFSTVLQSIILILQWIEIKLFNLGITTYNGRTVGTFGQPNSAAGFIVVGFGISLGLYWGSRKRGYMAIALICLLGIITTASLGGLMAMVVTTFVFLVGYVKKRKMKIILIGLLLMALVGIGSFGLKKEAIINYRVESRLSIWPASLKLIFKRPLIGYGAENLGAVFPAEYGGESIDRAHNELLDVLLMGGVFLGVVYVTLVGGALIGSFKHNKLYPIFLGLIGAILRGSVEPSLIVNLIVFWLLLAAALYPKGQG